MMIMNLIMLLWSFVLVVINAIALFKRKDDKECQKPYDNSVFYITAVSSFLIMTVYGVLIVKCCMNKSSIPLKFG
jgi:hypothetical protein